MRRKENLAAMLFGLLAACFSAGPRRALAQQQQPQTTPSYPQTAEGFNAQMAVVVDTVGNHSLLACSRALNPKGTCIGVGAPGGRWMIGPMALGFTAPLLSRFVGRRLGVVLTKPNNPDLVVIQDLLKTGKVKPVNEVSAAIRYLEEGHARGKVVITVE